VKRWYLWLLSPPAIVLLAVAATANLPREDRQLLTDRTDWSDADNGHGNVQQLPTQGTHIHTERIDTYYWTLGLFGGDGSAKLVSTTFPAPRWISLAVTGDLTRPGNNVYFALEGRDRRVPVRVRTTEFFWRRFTCSLPSDWVGKPIRLVAEARPRSQASNYFGVSNPRAVGWGTIVDYQVRALTVLPMAVVALLLFLVPGLPPALWLVRSGRVASNLLVSLTLVFSCLAGYATFWVFFPSPDYGPYFAGAILFGSTAWLVAESGKSASRALIRSEKVLTPVALMGLVCLLSLSLLYSVDLEIGAEGQPRYRFLDFVLAFDNEIPFSFAEPLYEGQDVREAFPKDVPGWHSSDRPPLQTGLILLQMPFARLAKEPRLGSLVVGIVLQSAWVPAVWALWTAACLPRRQAGLALLFVLLTGFALINTTFAWPKMLAAALSLFAVTIVLYDWKPRGERLPLSKAVLFGMSAALASLGHGGVAFTLLPLGVLLLMPRWYPGFSRLAVAGAVYVAMLGPWLLYQRFYDPPGTKLLKLHLAGVTAETETEEWKDDRPTWQNVLAAYRAKSVREILSNKLANVKALFTAAPDQYPWPSDESPPTLPVGTASYRRCDFLTLFWALGFLNAGWVVALTHLRQRPLPLDRDLGVTLPILGLASILTWVVVMFGPDATVVHQGSYATFLLIFASLAAWLTTLPRKGVNYLLAAQGALFAVVWLVTSPANTYGLPNVFVIPLALLFFGLLVHFALGTQPDPGPSAAKVGLTA
jgi:hypothetical protein